MPASRIAFVLGVLAVAACNDQKVIAHVADHVDTTVTRHFEVIARDGQHCTFSRNARDTVRLVAGDSIRCDWSNYGY